MSSQQSFMPDEAPRHGSAPKKVRKRFAVEFRSKNWRTGEWVWAHWQSYATERDRDQAVAQLNKANARLGWSYRAVQPEPEAKP